MEDTRAADAREATFQEQTKALLVKYEAMLTLLEKPSPKTYADLPEHTRDWLEGKSAKELNELDATIEFVVSSRIAGKVLAYVGGAAVMLIGYAVATAKFGWDAFSWIRSLPR